MARDSRASIWLASALFFLSGATALAYQVIWFKRFAHVWGSSSLAMAGVVAGFLLGLGVGARWLGGLADRVRSPLRGYGLCELGIGVLALAVPFELSLLSSWTADLHRVLQPHPLAHAALRLLVAFFVLGPPCILMGATLPLLVRRYTSTRDGLGPATGWLYAVNTLGAAFGCYVTGFHLLPTIGLASTHVLAVVLNLVIGTLAVVLGGGGGMLAAAAMEGDAPGKVELPRGVGLAGLLVGAGALMLQMVWMRQAALVHELAGAPKPHTETEPGVAGDRRR